MEGLLADTVLGSRENSKPKTIVGDRSSIWLVMVPAR
jgi:hypothetical protein